MGVKPSKPLPPNVSVLPFQRSRAGNSTAHVIVEVGAVAIVPLTMQASGNTPLAARTSFFVAVAPCGRFFGAKWAQASSRLAVDGAPAPFAAVAETAIVKHTTAANGLDRIRRLLIGGNGRSRV